MPRLLYPFAGARVSYYRARFEWTGVRDATAYQIQVAKQQTFADPYVEDTTVERHFAADLLVPGPLWWRVRALDQLGEPGPWSVVRRLEVEPPPLAASVRGIALEATAVAGGGLVDAVVTLDQGAPWRGATVLLSASDPALVSLPPQVLFPAGQESARFTVKAAAVDGNAEVSIVANSRGEPRLATLRIGPPRPAPALVGLAVQPGVLAAGGAAEGKVTLAGQTTSQTTVRLASSDASRVSVPPAVVVPARANGASFRVRALHTTSTANVTITASLDGIVKTTTLDLTAADGQDPLPAPVPIAPAYGVTLPYNGSGEFTWSSVMGAASYTIEVSAAKSFDSAPAVIRTVPYPSVTIAPLASGAFWWHVRANDAKGSPGRWSTERALAVR